MASDELLPKDDVGEDLRIVLLGGRWGGKSSAGNTILGEERFDSGRQRTAKSENRHGTVAGRELIVVDTPGWKGYLSLRETTAADKEEIKRSVCQCLPGPHAFLLVIPVDSAFTEEHKRSLVDHLKLMGDRVWRYSMVLFTCGDWLGEKTIEEHIKTEGDSLQWLIEKCRNRFHVISNKNRKDPTQVTQLLEKVEEMVVGNDGGYFEVEECTCQTMSKKKTEVEAKVKQRKMQTDRCREKLRELLQGMEQPTELRAVLLGSRNAGKSASGNTILDSEEFNNKKGTSMSVVKSAHVAGTSITIVDTPGWWKGFSVQDTTKQGKQELKRSVSLCLPGPHVFLLVIDTDVAFTEGQRKAVEEHLELISGQIWNHTMILFSRADWLGSKSIEQHIEEEGKALQWLVEKCGNRYHALDNKNKDNKAQVTELLQKMKEMVAGNGGSFLAAEERALQSIEEGRKEVEEKAKKRMKTVQVQRERFQGEANRLAEMRMVLMGQKSSGKSASGTTILGQEVFLTTETEQCEMAEASVFGRWLTVVNTPGWWENPARCTLKQYNEIMKGLSLSQPGPHAVLLVIPVDIAYEERHRRALEDHLCCLGGDVWRHAIVLFTYGDRLGETVEEHIEREGWPLQWVVEKCGNRYHLLNNKSRGSGGQVVELLEKMEEMVAGNDGEYFSPDMRRVYREVQNKFKRMEAEEIKVFYETEMKRKEEELNGRFEEEWRNRETELFEEVRKLLTEMLGKHREKHKLAGKLHIKPHITLNAKESKIQKEQRKNEEVKKRVEDVMAGLGKRSGQDKQMVQMETSQDCNPPQLSGGMISQERSSDLHSRKTKSMEIYPPSMSGSTEHMVTDAVRKMNLWLSSASSATSVSGGMISQENSSDLHSRKTKSMEIYPPSMGGSTEHMRTDSTADKLDALREMMKSLLLSNSSTEQDSGINSALGSLQSFTTAEHQAESGSVLPPGTGSR